MRQNWLFPCNPNNYDVLNAFANNIFVDWGTNLKVKLDDFVYIYVGAPIKKILIRAVVVEENVTDFIVDDSNYHEDNYEDIKVKKKYVKLKINKCYLGEDMYDLSYDKLLQNGLNGVVRGQMSLDNNPQLKDYIKDI